MSPHHLTSRSNWLPNLSIRVMECYDPQACQCSMGVHKWVRPWDCTQSAFVDGWKFKFQIMDGQFERCWGEACHKTIGWLCMLNAIVPWLWYRFCLKSPIQSIFTATSLAKPRMRGSVTGIETVNYTLGSHCSHWVLTDYGKWERCWWLYLLRNKLEM